MATCPNDPLIPLRDVPALPWMPRRNGKKLHVSTVFRWAHKGVGMRRLVTCCVGGMLCTTEAALRDFFSPAASAIASDATPPTPASRARQIRQADHEARELLGLDEREVA